MLSRLLGDPIYESYARRAINALWKHRNTTTDLFSNDINIDTGLWISKVKNWFKVPSNDINQRDFIIPILKHNKSLYLHLTFHRYQA